MQKKKKIILAALLVVAVAVALGASLSTTKNDATVPNASKAVAATPDENRPTLAPYSTAHLPALGTPVPMAIVTKTPTTSLAAHPTTNGPSLPTPHPTVLPSTPPTLLPPTNHPSLPSTHPSTLPSTPPTTLPTTTQTSFPTTLPSTTKDDTTPMARKPSASPTPSSAPTPTISPTSIESSHGCGHALALGQAACNVTIFYAIADVPYSSTEALALPSQVQSLPDNAEFLIHLGDIRSAAKENDCVLSDYQNIAATLKLSRVPVFLVPGGKCF